MEAYSSHKNITLLCSLGLFIAGYIFYSSSLIEYFYTREFNLISYQIGIAQGLVPLGAVLGAIVAGKSADLFGRKKILAWNFMALLLFGILSACIFDFYSLCAFRLIHGFLGGMLYPLCASYMTEMTPKHSLAKQSAILMFINCLASPVACIVTIFLSLFLQDQILWRVIIISYIIPIIYGLFLARTMPESVAWLDAKQNKNINGVKITHFFNKTYFHLSVCLLGAWFLMDVAYYGINFFVPYLLDAMKLKSLDHGVSSIFDNQTLWGTFIVNLFFMLGAFSAIFIVEHIDLIKLQKYGFFLAALSLLILAICFYVGLNHSAIVVLLFVIFNFALNAGPGVTTYLLSATSYPVEMRGLGHGLNAGVAKFGSFLGVLLLPILHESYGLAVIILLSILLFAAFFLTIIFSRFVNKSLLSEAELNYETN